jgi:MoaA/NifB/PqqE/SkfB family radical SAM enzyme
MSYIDPRGKVFAHLDRLARWQDGASAPPVTIEWDLSNVCSLACQDCHFAHTHVAGPWAAATVDRPVGYAHTGRFAGRALVERGLVEMAACGVEGIVWSGGGEPTLHPAFADIVQTAAGAGLQQGLYTLGGHITAHLAGQLESLAWAVVSLDAETPERYAAEKAVGPDRFHAACEGIRRLVAHVPVVGASFLLGPHNYTHTEAMLALARELGVTYTTFRPAILTKPSDPGVVLGDRTWLEPMAVVAKRLAKEPDVIIDPGRFGDVRTWTGHGYTTCYGIRMGAVVTPDGRVWVCPNRRGVQGSELGSLAESSFADIWAKHPGQWTDFRQCRAMCRYHHMNQTLAAVFAPKQHEAFV